MKGLSLSLASTTDVVDTFELIADEMWNDREHMHANVVLSNLWLRLVIKI